MAVSSHNFSPFIPSDTALVVAALPDKAVQLYTQSARIAGLLSPSTRETLRQYMAVINSYYSNLIEGNYTKPHEIRAAQQGNYLSDPAKRDLQLESVAHIQVQHWIHAQNPNWDTLYSPEFIQAAHREFYRNIPESLWSLKNTEGDIVEQVTPGAWRSKSVVVGQHQPPESEAIPGLIQSFCDRYHPRHYPGDRKLIAAAAAHHRLLWIHPFADGNGRVARLLTDAMLRAAGLECYGVWCLSRGLARSSATYKALLARADFPRQGSSDGRGLLSEAGLVEFCAYLLDTALDQMAYIEDLLSLSQMRERIDGYVAARRDQRAARDLPSFNEREAKAAGRLLMAAFSEGLLPRTLALSLCDMPERSASRLLSRLRDEGLLSQTSSKSPLRWEIPEHAEPWYFPQLTPH